MEIQRYNQGFGGFGPLEKCDTGKLVLADEVLPALETANRRIQGEAKYNGELREELNGLHAMRDYWADATQQAKEERNAHFAGETHWKDRLNIAVALIVVYWTACVYDLIKYAFTGHF